MNLIDYIFYRLYLGYQKRNYFASFTAILFFTTIGFSLVFPIAIFLSILFDTEDKIIFLTIMLTSAIVIFIYHLKHFNKKKVESIKKTYNKHPYNKKINEWVFYISGVLLIWIGYLGSVPAARLAKWILTNWIK